jgi:glycosyltransferase involved in cell wall biosynthesis
MKKKILFLHPGPIYRPDLPEIKDKYLMLSKDFAGVILSWTDDKEFRCYKIGSFIFCGLKKAKGAYLGKLKLALAMFIHGLTLHRRESFDVIICYDPMFTGTIGVLLKFLTGCKLIIEVNNSDILLAISLNREKRIRTKIKTIIYKTIIPFSLSYTDSIKLLTRSQSIPLYGRGNGKNIFRFHDFVATHFFSNQPSVQENTILFVGFPFYRKGVDILIKAFERISYKYPKFKLKLIGYRLEEDAKNYFSSWGLNIQFCPPMFYNKLRAEFLGCYCFVLPSREEGIARVLLEVMASGKPVIGSGIPGTAEAIEDRKSGLLFRSEDINDLAAKLEILLGNSTLANKMGTYGRKVIEQRYSSEKYCEYFNDMIKKTLRN